jgi:hypothetical protein
MKHIFNIFLLITFISVIITSCDDTIVGNQIIPEFDVSYSKHIQPLFNNHCNNTTCHNSEDRAGGLSFEIYGEFRSYPFLIIAGAPDESTLYQVVSGQSVLVMPPYGGPSIPLTENQINGIRTWIEEGAEAN